MLGASLTFTALILLNVAVMFISGASIWPQTGAIGFVLGVWTSMWIQRFYDRSQYP